MTAEERIALIQAKIQRAKKHLADLKLVRDGFLQRTPYVISSKPETKPGYEGFDLYFMSRVDPIPDEIGIIFGDGVHNLRSALDHLAFQLVEVAGNTASDQTCFPIFKSAQDERSFGKKVRGMSQAAIDKIRSIEPYKDGKSHELWVLHKLDIADKHHQLFTMLIRVTNITIHIPGRFSLDGRSPLDLPMPQFAAPGFREALEVNKPFFTCQRGTERNTEFRFDVAINQKNVSDPKPAVWALEFLIGTVEHLVVDFKSLLA